MAKSRWQGYRTELASREVPGGRSASGKAANIAVEAITLLASGLPDRIKTQDVDAVTMKLSAPQAPARPASKIAPDVRGVPVRRNDR